MMPRKKWTRKPEFNDVDRKFKDRRKWQLAFRRYIIERHPSEFYAPYFGLDIETYRKWLSLQFSEDLNWANFGSKWQFSVVVPLVYFDFSNHEDLTLCWNFINMRIEPLNCREERKIDMFVASSYYERLYEKTGFAMCLKMMKKLEDIKSSYSLFEPELEKFIIENSAYTEQLTKLSPPDFMRINKGATIKDLLLEREIFRKFG